jgi:hypothetical protein
VLLGAQAQNEPPLHLDDFLVALRNLHGRYPGIGVGEGVLTHPAMSLDPLPDTMVQLQQLGEELSRAKLGPEFDDILSRWHRTCLAPQQVRIMGIPRDTRFARIMVQSDYIIKRVADGDANLKIDRFQSLMDRNLGQAIEDIESGRLAAALSLTRFWLTPGTRTYSSSERSVLIGICRVRLMQEEQLLTATGQLTAGGAGNELAARFACNFSRRYPDIAVADPLYRDLENLYRWMTVARLIIDSQAVERSGLSLRVLIERFPLRSYSMPLTLPGHSTVGNHDWETKQMRYFIRFPTCGGVELPFDVGSVLPEAPKPRILADISERTLGSRPTPETAFWALRE